MFGRRSRAIRMCRPDATTACCFGYAMGSTLFDSHLESRISGMKTSSCHRLAGSTTLLLALAMSAAAGDLAGRVSGPGGPLAGASVTAQGANGVATTVYSGLDGGFRVGDIGAQKYNVRVRYPGLEDRSLEASRP